MTDDELLAVIGGEPFLRASAMAELLRDRALRYLEAGDRCEDDKTALAWYARAMEMDRMSLGIIRLADLPSRVAVYEDPWVEAPVRHLKAVDEIGDF